MDLGWMLNFCKRYLLVNKQLSNSCLHFSTARMYLEQYNLRIFHFVFLEYSVSEQYAFSWMRHKPKAIWSVAGQTHLGHCTLWSVLLDLGATAFHIFEWIATWLSIFRRFFFLVLGMVLGLSIFTRPALSSLPSPWSQLQILVTV